MLVHCFGSFLLQDVFLNLQVFAFVEQDMTFVANVFPCILYRDAGPGCDRTVFASTVGRFLSRVSYLLSYIFFSETP